MGICPQEKYQDRCWTWKIHCCWFWCAFMHNYSHQENPWKNILWNWYWVHSSDQTCPLRVSSWNYELHGWPQDSSQDNHMRKYMRMHRYSRNRYYDLWKSRRHSWHWKRWSLWLCNGFQLQWETQTSWGDADRTKLIRCVDSKERDFWGFSLEVMIDNNIILYEKILSWHEWFSIKVAQSEEKSFQKIKRIHHVQDVYILWKFCEHDSRFSKLIFDDHISWRVYYIFFFKVKNQISIFIFFCHSSSKSIDSFIFTILVCRL